MLTGSADGEADKGGREEKVMDRRRAAQLRKEEEKARKEAAKREKERKKRAKEEEKEQERRVKEERDREKRGKEKKERSKEGENRSEDEGNGKGTSQKGGDGAKVRSQGLNQVQAERSSGSEEEQGDVGGQRTSMKYPPLNLEGRPLVLLGKGKAKTADSKQPSSSRADRQASIVSARGSPGPQSAEGEGATREQMASAPALSEVPGSGQTQEHEQFTAGQVDSEDRPRESGHWACLSQNDLERLEDDFSGRPVELSQTILSIVLTIYRSCAAEPNAAGAAPAPSPSLKRRPTFSRFRKTSSCSSAADLQEPPQSHSSPFAQGSTSDLSTMAPAPKPDEVMRAAIHRLSEAVEASSLREDGEGPEGTLGAVENSDRFHAGGSSTPGLSGAPVSSPVEGQSGVSCTGETSTPATFPTDTPERRLDADGAGSFCFVDRLGLEKVAAAVEGPEPQDFLRFTALTELLRYVEPQMLTQQEKVVFWVNIYNALGMHGYLVYGVPKSHYKWVMFLNKVSYLIGGNVFSLLTIEHSILRAASHRPALAGLLPVQRFKPSNPAYACALKSAEPLVTFALSCGSASSPPVRMYSLPYVKEQLQEAATWYLEKHVDLSSPNKIILPKLLQWYGKDFAPSTARLLEWIAANMPEPKKEQLLRRIRRRPVVYGDEKIEREGGAKGFQVSSYDWKFSYVLGSSE